MPYIFVHAPLSWLRPSVLRRSRHIRSVSKTSLQRRRLGRHSLHFTQGSLTRITALLANRDAGKLNSPRNVRLKRACTDWTGKAEAPRSTRADQRSLWHVFVGVPSAVSAVSSGYAGEFLRHFSYTCFRAASSESVTSGLLPTGAALGSSPSGVDSSGSSTSLRRV